MAGEIAGSLRESQSGRQVTFVIAPDLMTTGDPQLIRVVLDNLLTNAWKFTSKQASATIEVGRTRRPEREAFFVRDDGAGFDMEHAKMLFTPFQRLHRQDEFEGTGVGLATVQRIVHRHLGSIWAEGAVGRGATFHFTLWERSDRG